MLKNVMQCFILGVILWAASSCSQTQLLTVGAAQSDSTGTYSSEKEHNLNVVYLYPKGTQPLANYHRRLSGLLTYMQQYVGDEMVYNGFQRKTFGLLRDTGDSTLIKVIAIEGNQTGYTKAEGGGQAAIADIKAYFTAHPGLESSAHTLIFIPSVTGEHGWDMNTGSVLPFNGAGKWCLVVDYLNFDMVHFRTGTQEGDALKVGSITHELMHALGVAHDRENYQETSQWECLMSGGGGKLSKIESANKIHITKAAAAVLDVNQVMNGTGDYYSTPAPTVSLEKLSVKTDQNNAIHLQLKATSAKALKHLAVYNDEEPAYVNEDYDALAWQGTFANNEVDILMPINQFYPARTVNNIYQMRLVFLHEDGSQTTKKAAFKIINGVPQINIDIDANPGVELDKTNWSVTATSEELNAGATQGPKEMLIDGNINTFWHTKWTSPASVLPQSFTVDMGQTTLVKGLRFVQRQENGNAQYNQVHVKDYQVEVSTDNNNWQSIGAYSLMSETLTQKLTFSTPQNIRYFRVTVNNVYSNKKVAALAEVGAF